ncbi:hypothetical protein QL285_015704 [Trifolium repens]|nr:hypothetical protein QL285_015704 [Trifolium repens]
MLQSNTCQYSSKNDPIHSLSSLHAKNHSSQVKRDLDSTYIKSSMLQSNTCQYSSKNDPIHSLSSLHAKNHSSQKRLRLYT